MRLRAFRPGRRLLWLALATMVAVFALALVEGQIPQWGLSQGQIGGGLVGALLVVALWDLGHSRAAPDIQIERRLPSSLALGRWTPVQLRLWRASGQPLNLELFDHYPDDCQMTGLPLRLSTPAEQGVEVSYRVRPIARGPAEFAGLEIRLSSRWGLWELQFFQDHADQVKVYPDFSAMAGFALAVQERPGGAGGIRRLRSQGSGTEFHQLREHQQGDSPRQIDWKATSRQLRLVSREYQDERDQQVILVLDTGQRMRTRDGELSHFDQALNTALMLAHLALRQGDAVGVMSFGQHDRWIPAVKGTANISQLLNACYDLDAGPHASDFLMAARSLASRQRKRALILLLTNLRDEDGEDLLHGLKLLRERHLVLVANLREVALDHAIKEPVTDFQGALRYAGTEDYLAQRRALQDRLQAEGVLLVDCTPRELTNRVIERYLEIKRARRL